jgi:enoyl-CoA hydratase
MSYETLRVENEPPVSVVFINRPKALNALNSQVLDELCQVFFELNSNEEISVVVITGEGEKAFVAGADIGEMSSLTSLEGERFMRKGQETLSMIENLDKIVIAAVNGFALGGGCELAMACDIRLAARSAKIGQPEVNLGIIPGFGGTQRLSRLVGRGKAKQLIFSGDHIPAEEAHRIGLVDEVYDSEELLEKAKELAGKIASKGPLAVRACKMLINKGLDCDLDTGLHLEREAIAVLFSTQDQKEGMKAFLEKRKPDFKGL